LAFRRIGFRRIGTEPSHNRPT